MRVSSCANGAVILCLAVWSVAAAQTPGANLDAAIAGFNRAIKSDSGSGAAWYGLGSALEARGQLADAVAAFTRSERLNYQLPGSELRLARLYTRLGEDDAAFTHLAKAADVGFAPSSIDNEPAFDRIKSTVRFNTIRTQAVAARYPCRAVHTFDFWSGDFEIRPWAQPNVPPTGQVHNTREYDGCVIVEHFSNPSAAGMSMSFYDVNRRVWRMIWNDDRNGSNDFEGAFVDGAMRFNGWVLDANGNRQLARNTLQPVSADTIRQTYSVSPDSGKTWLVMTDGSYTRKKP
ncbi:MAG TPA: tetratricopeptide repeat protein [Gemmatimonadaceae bacterium]|jgi:tetratricopeptide (TPR) repeat protein